MVQGPTSRYIPPGRDRRGCKYGWFDVWDWFANRVIQLSGSARIEVGEGEIAIDTHIHTMFSHCSISSPESIISRAVAVGLGGVAAMDHESNEAYQELCLCANDLKRRHLIPETFLAVPGIELNSTSGHIGALFVEEPLPSGCTPARAVDLIHEAGGLAVAVHPYHRSGIGSAVFDAPFDAVEMESAGIFTADFAEENRKLCSDARLQAAAKLGSSDSHYVYTIGACYTVAQIEEPTLDGLREAIVRGKTVPRVSPGCVRLRRALGMIPRYRKAPGRGEG